MAPQQRKSRSIGGTNFQRVNAAAVGGRWIVLLLLVVAFLALDVQLQCVQGANYTVGDQFGWSLPEANGFNSSYYNDEWLTTLVLYPRDILFFNYKVPAHSVLQVSEIDYISCNYNSPLEKYTSGADSVGPLSAGMYWFICGTPSHCSMGMRMAVPVEMKPSLGPPFQLAPPPAPTPPESSTELFLSSFLQDKFLSNTSRSNSCL
ncbi:unnamed protein product [Sphagnum troendelagicum]|uniref:Phytocyanin domain-containing protein n=1 Tax=Sphagnum troendelagicum TaxID=128251 RepID=A0ABP0U2V7_9BRYO